MTGPQLPNPAKPFDQSWKQHDELWLESKTAIRAAVPGVAELNLRYGPDERQVVDVYQPPNPKGLVVWMHPGGWQHGTKTSETAAQLAATFIGLGYAFAATNYRLVPEHVWPSQGDDTLAAIDAARLAVGGDVRIALIGASAGAQLACWAASRVDAVVAAAAWFGPYDFSATWGDAAERLISAYVGPPGDPRRHEASPRTWADAAKPTFLVWDDLDELVPPVQFHSYRASLIAAKVPTGMAKATGAGHSLGIPPQVYTAGYVQASVTWCASFMQ